MLSVPQTKCMECGRCRVRVPGKTVCRECWQKVVSLLKQPQPSTPTETNDMTKTRENEEKALRAVAEAEKAAIADSSYRLPSRNELGIKIGLDNYFYAETIGSKRAKAAWFEAQDRLNQLKAQQQPAVSNQQTPPTLFAPPPTLLSTTPRLPTPDLYQQKLEEDNARLRAEIEALRTQIQQTLTIPPNDRALLQTLKDEDQRLRTEADQVLVKIDELQRQHQRLLAEADAIGRLIEQREATLERVEQTQVAFVAALAETNGRKALAGVA